MLVVIVIIVFIIYMTSCLIGNGQFFPYVRLTQYPGKMEDSFYLNSL